MVIAVAQIAGYCAGMSKSGPDNEDEARIILRRVEADNASFLTGSVDSAREKVAGHFAGRDTAGEDAVVTWATRIGRALGLIFFAALVVNLFTGWFF